MSKNIQLIIGSTRQNRLATSIAEWVKEQVVKVDDIKLEVVDLKQENLPVMDAPMSPSRAPVDTPAGKAWADKIASADGYIFLTPEYNRSIPASLKNAIDYLSAEWHEKPAIIVSYGFIDGGKSANTHLQDILSWLKVDHDQKQITIHIAMDMLDKSGQIGNANQALAQYEDSLSEALQKLV